MLRWIYGHRRQDKIGDDYISERVEVTCITGKMVENCLSWTCPNNHNKSLVRRVDQTTWSPIKRGRGRPRGTFGVELIERDLLVNNITKELVNDRT